MAIAETALEPTVDDRKQALTQERDAMAQQGRKLKLQIEVFQRDLAQVVARHAVVCAELEKLDQPDPGV